VLREAQGQLYLYLNLNLSCHLVTWIYITEIPEHHRLVTRSLYEPRLLTHP